VKILSAGLSLEQLCGVWLIPHQHLRYLFPINPVSSEETGRVIVIMQQSEQKMFCSNMPVA
jgi:hypothetical protein